MGCGKGRHSLLRVVSVHKIDMLVLAGCHLGAV